MKAIIGLILLSALTAAGLHYKSLISENGVLSNNLSIRTAERDHGKRAIQFLSDTVGTMSSELDAEEARRVAQEKRLNDLEIAKNFGAWAESDPIGFAGRMLRGTNRMQHDIEQASGGDSVAGTVPAATESPDDNQAENRTGTP